MLFKSNFVATLLALVIVGACGQTPTVMPLVPPTFEEKLSWILRLENERILRDESELLYEEADSEFSPAAAESVVNARELPDLISLLSDPEPQLRRRAAMAIGRVGRCRHLLLVFWAILQQRSRSKVLYSIQCQL